jgi:hypothetical protein
MHYCMTVCTPARCTVQSAYKILCDANYRLAGGMNRDDFKLRLSELLGVEMTEQVGTNSSSMYVCLY